MSGSGIKSTTQGVARRGRPTQYKEAKIRLNLSVTPRSRYYLGLVAHLRKTSMSEIIEEFATAMNQIQCGLGPLGHGSRREGSKALRGQSIYYEERKEALNLCVTPDTKRILQELAVKATEPEVKPSMSDVVERHCRCLAELYEDGCPYPGRRG
ncbi:hypothetical protein H6F75_27405 [Nodosilinea sp. FACHB-131]|uniref:hypothetical protein n=1 Tax=Cyanophyceae TaxID=3028117 RepID=UPI001688ABF6|nr:hypothetical protein [Nodosilinea sp. FACHB-131]MBD1877215.1 hypothetical protein [Nodosilinea sp. FACHB-131]